MNVLGCMVAFAAMALAYLSSRNQRVLTRPWGRKARVLAWLLAALALACWIVGETTLPGIFSTLTALMLGAVAFPYIVWLLKPAAERKTTLMLAKTFAGILLGCPLSMAIVGLAVYLWPGASESVLIPWLVVFFPLWTVVMAATFMFRSGRRAWAWLAVANVGAFAALFVAKHLLPGI